MQITILNNQTLFDLAIQVTGEALNAVKIAKSNNISVTEELIVGNEIFIDDHLLYDTNVINIYEKESVKPATDLTTEQLDQVIGCEGIGCWYVENDFIVQ